jgi:hypothetical protein
VQEIWTFYCSHSSVYFNITVKFDYLLGICVKSCGIWLELFYNNSAYEIQINQIGVSHQSFLCALRFLDGTTTDF